MKALRLSVISVCLLSFSNFSYAIQCPNNFKNVQVGDPIDVVIAACGSPTSQKEGPAPDNTPQEWSYYLPSPGTNNMMFQKQTTLKTTFSFDGSGKVVNISTNGNGSDSISCGGTSLEVGATRKEVEAACGKAIIVTKSDVYKAASNDADNKMVELYYAGPPSGTLVFIKGKLTEKKR